MSAVNDIYDRAFLSKRKSLIYTDRIVCHCPPLAEFDWLDIVLLVVKPTLPAIVRQILVLTNGRTESAVFPCHIFNVLINQMIPGR